MIKVVSKEEVEVKKYFNLLTNKDGFVNCMGLAGLSAFFLLNIAALIEYGKYALDMSNRFISFLPAIKLLLNIDLLFVISLILVYNVVEKFFSLKLLFIGMLLGGIVGASYFVVKDKPMAMIGILGLYGIGVSLITTIIGFSTLIRVLKKEDRHKASHYEL